MNEIVINFGSGVSTDQSWTCYFVVRFTAGVLIVTRLTMAVLMSLMRLSALKYVCISSVFKFNEGRSPRPLPFIPSEFKFGRYYFYFWVLLLQKWHIRKSTLLFIDRICVTCKNLMYISQVMRPHFILAK